MIMKYATDVTSIFSYNLSNLNLKFCIISKDFELCLQSHSHVTNFMMH